MLSRPLCIWVLSAAVAAGTAARSRGADVPGERPKALLVVVCPAEWTKDLAAYVKLRSQSLRVEVAAMEDVLHAEPGEDAPSRLKRFLFRKWRGEGLRYALLVGDADTLPVRFMVLDRKTDAAFNYAFYASDLYYADLARDDGSFDDWNQQREGFHARYFGEVRGEYHKTPPINYDRVSYVPEIAVGRWPVSDRAALAAVVAKTVAWEARVTEAEPRALFIHAGGWIDARKRVGQLAQAWAAAGWSVQRQFYGEKPGAPSPKTVSAAIRRGLHAVFHVGHGTNETWQHCLGRRERDTLATAPPAIYMSVGCSTAHFCTEPPYRAYLDERGIPHRGTNAGEVFRSPPPAPAALQPGRFNSTGLGERLIRMPHGGAVAYIGCNTGAQPCALSLLDGFANSVANGQAPRVGDAWRLAVAHYWRRERLPKLKPTQSWYPPSIFFQAMKFMLFGDPALPLPRPQPAAKTSRATQGTRP